MIETYPRVYAAIDLDAVRSNLESMRDNLAPGAKMVGVIKADAYGHGAQPIGRLMEELDYIWGYAVATVDEGVSLRMGGLKKPILLLGYLFPGQEEKAAAANLTCGIFSYERAQALSYAAVSQDKILNIHIKFDTGMSRVGFMDREEDYESIRRIAKLPGLKIEGAFSHFARADETDKSAAFAQQALFERMIERSGMQYELRHMCASAGIIDLPQAHYELVRAGISIYGLYPSEEVNREAVPLTPIMSLHSQIAHVKEVPANTPVSYGGTYVTEEPRRIATIPVGYGDGYPRLLSGKGYVLINGKKAPIRGRVCMDMFMVDVTEIPEAKIGTPVTLVGEDNGETIRVEDLSALCGRFNYEFCCDLCKRIPRVYIKGKKVVSTRDYFWQ